MELRKFFRISSTAIFTLSVMASWGMAQVKEAPTRDQIEDKYKWNLADFFATDEVWQSEFDALKARAAEMDQYEGKLSESSDMLAGCLMLNDTLGMNAHRLYVYASLKSDEDNRVGTYQEMSDKARVLYSQINQATAFIEPEILGIPDATLKAFLEKDKNLALYRFYLEDIIRRKAHIRSGEVEEVLALASPVTAGPSRIFTMVDDADIKFPAIKDETGADVELTKGRFGQIMQSQDRNVRRAASEAYNDTYKKYMNTLAATLTASVNDDIFYAKVRGYNSCLERALDGDNIPQSVFDNLIKAVNDNLEPLHKYISLRKKYLGVDTLFGFDLGVPLAPDVKK